MRGAIFKKYFKTEDWEEEFFSLTSEKRRIANYSGLDFLELDNLPFSFYLLLRRDSWIHSMERSEESREALKAIWRLTQTKADVKSIKKYKERRKK